jgi:glutamate decarboxylase
VQSINASGHKFSLAPPGVAWIIWKDRNWFPSSLFHRIGYLISPIDTISLNLSRSSAPLIAEYFYLRHLGFTGFQEKIGGFLAKARELSDKIEKLPWFVCISDIHRPRGSHLHNRHTIQDSISRKDHGPFNYGLPLVVFKFRPDIMKQCHLSLQSVSLKLKEKGYALPCEYNIFFICLKFAKKGWLTVCPHTFRFPSSHIPPATGCYENHRT